MHIKAVTSANCYSALVAGIVMLTASSPSIRNIIKRGVTMRCHFALNSSSSRQQQQRGETNRERVKEFGPFCIRVLVPSARRLLKPREVEEK